MQKCNLYLNQFSNKKGTIGKPKRPKNHLIWAAHPRTYLSTKYPPPPPGAKSKHQESQFQNCNQKQLFKAVDKLCSGSAEKILPSHVDAEQLANDFATFFEDKIKKVIRTNLATSPFHPPPLKTPTRKSVRLLSLRISVKYPKTSFAILSRNRLHHHVRKMLFQLGS